MGYTNLPPGNYTHGTIFQGIRGRVSLSGRFAYGGNKAKEQPPAEVGTTATRSDAAVTKSKKPQTDLGKQQNIAAAGDTVPIVFCKRSGTVGGTWVQPALVKTGSNDFVGSFLYAISQGQMVSSPVKYQAWVGTQSIQTFSSAGTLTLTHYYASVATMAAAKNVCPISAGKIFCDFNAYSYLGKLYGTSGTTERFPDVETYFYKIQAITRGSGDTNNSVIEYASLDIEVFDNKTGADITSAYWAGLGVTPGAGLTIVYNAVLSGSTVIGGNPVGYIDNFGISVYVKEAAGFFANLGSTGPFTVLYGNGTVDNQANLSLPADTGTLDGIQYEWKLSSYVDPTAPPGSADFTNFADITFLEIDGNIYDQPSSGSYPTTTRQLSIFYQNGTTVDLYSNGLVSGVYQTGASNQFVDLAMYLFTLMKRVSGATTASLAAPIDVSNLQTLATFCTNTGLFFNGIIEQSINTIDYIAKTAPFFLLSFVSSNGRYSLQPLLPLSAGNTIKTTALTAAATFTEANIIPGTFQKNYVDADERRPINISLVWREADPLIIGIQRTTTVRYSTTDSNAPTVQFDMTDFCTSAAHAAVYGKYELARRKFSTHSISFSTPLLTTSLIPTQIIEVQRQRINSRGDNRQETDWYQITNVKHSSDGISVIEAAHFPVDGSDIARISNEVVNGTFEVI